MGIARWERIRRGRRGSCRKGGVRGGGWLFGDLIGEARVVWKGGLMELLSSGVKWRGWVFLVFSPQDVPGNCRKDMVFRGVLAG